MENKNDWQHLGGAAPSSSVGRGGARCFWRGVTESSCSEEKNTGPGGSCRVPRPAAPPTGSVYPRRSGSGGYFQQTRGRRCSEVGPWRFFRFKVRFAGIEGVGTSASRRTSGRSEEPAVNRADHLRTEGKELGSVQSCSGLSCLAPMSGLLLLWGSSGSRLSLFRGVNQSSLVLQGLIESLKPTQQW